MTRQKGPDEVFCRSCGEPIKRAAELCPNCGVRNHAAASATSHGSTSDAAGGSNANASRPHDPAEYETTVSDAWYVGVVAGIGLSLVGFAIFSGEPTGPIEDVGGFSFLGGWFLLPLAVYYDTKYVRANSRWNPDTGVWVVLALVWFVNVVAAAVYLYRRHEALGVP